MEGCSREAMERTARSGHLEVAKLLHDIGATCTSTAVHLAQVHGHHDVFHFLNAMYPGKVGIPSYSTISTHGSPGMSLFLFMMMQASPALELEFRFSKGFGSATIANVQKRKRVVAVCIMLLHRTPRTTTNAIGPQDPKTTTNPQGKACGNHFFSASDF